MKDLQKAVIKEKEALKELVKASIAVGAKYGVSYYLVSSEFEEEAMKYLEEREYGYK